jgi:membrane protein implicated in regulation of membrane protease activity
MSFTPELIWFIVGLALILSEFMMPGIILVFFGLGAWLTALTSWLGLTPGWGSQLITFAVSSVVLLVLLRRRFRSRLFGYVRNDQDPELNLDDFAGQEVTVLADIPAGGIGHVEYKGASWQARSERALAGGTTAVITRADGITLVVRPRD